MFALQTGIGAERSQRYVGPETPELLERIAHHQEVREDERERRTLVSTLVRPFSFPRPLPGIGDVDIAQFKNVSVAVEDSTPLFWTR